MPESIIFALGMMGGKAFSLFFRFKRICFEGASCSAFALCSQSNKDLKKDRELVRVQYINKFVTVSIMVLLRNGRAAVTEMRRRPKDQVYTAYLAS